MLQIFLFGGLRVLLDGRPLKLAVLPKTTPLFAYLLLHRSRPLPRDALAFTLWPDFPEPAARSNLRRHLHDLNHALPPDAGAPWLLIDANTVEWNDSCDHWVDVAEFESAVTAPERLAVAIALYKGDLLEGVYDDCLFSNRERLRNQYFSMVKRLVCTYSLEGEFAQGIACAQQALGRDPLREDLARDLMTLQDAAGNRAAALQEYRRIERTLRTELNVEPMPETVGLYETIRSGRHEVPDTRSVPQQESSRHLPVARPRLDRPSLSPAPTGRHESPAPCTLPVWLTHFFGRESELAALQGLLCPRPGARPGSRLIVLSGMGGIGKTRLAVEAVTRLVQRTPGCFPDGVFFVPLAELKDSTFVPQAIMQALGLTPSATSLGQGELAEHLRARRLLLILDNFECVIGATQTVTSLLAAAPGVTALVISRTALHAYGDQEFPVPPMPLPDLGRLPDMAKLTQCPAIAVFIDRAHHANPGFVLSAHDAALVSEICAQLDGLPLAIELAAAHANLLSPAALLTRVRTGLAVLAGHRRDAPQRQQSMVAALDWSYNLLDQPAQRLFAHLAVFDGSFGLADAHTVADDAQLAAAGATPVEGTLWALVDHSMLLPVFEAVDGAGPRFRMMHVLRKFGLAKLAVLREAHSLSLAPGEYRT